MAVIAQQAATIAQLVADAAELRALLAAEKAKTEARREKAAEKKRRQRGDVPTDVPGLSRDMSPETLTPPVPPTSPAPRTPHPHPPHNPPLNPAHVLAHVGTPEPLPFEDGPVLEPGEGDDILEARIPALVQVSSGVPDAESPEAKRRKRRVHQVSEPFEAFWRLRKWSGDKPVAYKRWVTAGLDVDEAKREVAMAAVVAQLADRAKAATAGVWYADWKHAEGWISGQRWNDPLKCEAGPKVVPIAAGPADDLAGYRKLVAWCHSDRERVEVLVDRARGVNKVVLDVAEALEILEGRGIDAAIRWVAMATQAGVKARQGVSRG